MIGKHVLWAFVVGISWPSSVQHRVACFSIVGMSTFYRILDSSKNRTKMYDHVTYLIALIQPTYSYRVS